MTKLKLGPDLTPNPGHWNVKNSNQFERVDWSVQYNITLQFPIVLLLYQLHMSTIYSLSRYLSAPVLQINIVINLSKVIPTFIYIELCKNLLRLLNWAENYVRCYNPVNINVLTERISFKKFTLQSVFQIIVYVISRHAAALWKIEKSTDRLQ